MKIIFAFVLMLLCFSSCLKEYTCSCKKSDNEFPEINTTDEFKITATKNNRANKCSSNDKSEETFTVKCKIVE